MAYKLQLKRGVLASLPNGSVGEPLFTTDTFDLYVGKGDGTNVKIQKFIASGSSSQFLKGDGSLDSNTYIGLTALSASAPLSYNNTTGAFTISQAGGSTNGYLSSGDWTTFNAKQAALSGSGIVKSTGGTISYLTDNSANWDTAYNDKINSASVSGTTTKTLTLTQQDGGTITTSWSDYDTAPVTSVFGRTGAVVAANGDYTTSQVTEGTNLYYTDARARAAITLTTTGSSGASTYVGGTLNIPTYTLAGLGGVASSRQLNINGTSYDLSADRSWSVGTVTSVDMSVPTGFAISGNPITSSGTLALAFATGYSLPTNASQTNWDAAYNDKINSASVTGTTTKTLTLTQQDGGTITASWTDDNTDSVTSVFGRTGAVVAQSGDYTTTQVTEGTNLYYTEGRVSANTDVAANTAARHNAVTLGTANGLSLSTQVLSLGLSSSSANGALSSTDWSTFNGKQNAITLTTTGTSGAATLIGSTLNIPQYADQFVGTVTSVGLSAPTGFSVAGTPVTSSGTLALSFAAGYSLPTTASQSTWDSAYNNMIVSAAVTGTTTKTLTLTQQDAGTITASWTDDNSGTVTSVGLSSATSGVTIGSSPVTTSGTITLAIATASGSGQGLLSSSDWTTFNNKQNAITLTTTGTSGAATLVGATLNIPQYADQFVGTVTSVAALTIGTTGTDLSSTVANSTTTPVITLNVPTASATNRGALSAADWNTFNNKQNALTNPVTGTGTTNYLPKFTGTSTIGNSLVFDNGTNVGVNTSTPNDYIDGESGMAILRATNGRAVLSLVGTRTDAGETLGRISFTNTNSTNAGAKRLAYISGIRGTTNNSAYLEFAVANDTLGAVAMILNQTGNLGLGVTPSAWWSGVNVFELPNGVSFFGNTSVSASSITTNAFFNTSTTWIYKTSAQASRYDQYQGQHQWYNAPSGTAGAAISFTQAMTLDASGNLGLGNTSPTIASGYRSFIANGTSGTIIRTQVNGTTAFDIQADPTITYLWENRNYPIAFGTNGTERMRISASGNLSIGNTNNTYKLDVSGTGRFSGRITSNATIVSNNDNGAESGFQYYDRSTGVVWLDYAQSGYRYFYNSAVGNIVNFSQSGAATFSSSVTAGGNIDITTNAYLGGLLKISRALVDPATSGSADPNYFTRYLDSAGSRVLDMGVGTSSAWLQSRDKNNYAVNYNLLLNPNGGNVGIGTTSPNAKLAVTTDTTGTEAENIRLEMNTSAVPSSAGLNFRFGSVNGATIYGVGENGSTGASSMRFYTHNGTSSAERMRITSGGDLLVGLTTGGRFSVRDAGGNDTHFGLGANYDNYITAGSSGVTIFRNATTERMRITSGGDVGIGTSSPTSQANYRFLQVNGTNSAIIETMVGGTRIGGFDSDASNLYVGSIGSYPIVFRTAVTERMRITSGGNLLVGTTTDSGERLVVSGSVKITGNIYMDYNNPIRWKSSSGDYRQIISYADDTYIDARDGGMILRTGTGGTATERIRIKSNGSVRYIPIATPSTAEAGDVYYDSTSNKLRCYNGTSWNDLF